MESPFRAKVSREEYIKQVTRHFTRKAPSREALIAHMIREGIIMNHYSLASYFILKWNDALKIADGLVQEGKLEKFLDSGNYGVDYFLRIDIWENYSAFMIKSKRKKEHPLVDMFDIIAYYGLTVTTLSTRFLPKLRQNVVRFPKNKHYFFHAKDIANIQDTEDFRDAISKSMVKFSAQYIVKPEKIKVPKREATKRAYTKVADEDFIFRDTSCKNYDNCYEFAVKHTNYINCNKCSIYRKKANELVLEILTHGAVFVPPKKEGKYSHIINNQSLPNMN